MAVGDLMTSLALLEVVLGNRHDVDRRMVRVRIPARVRVARKIGDATPVWPLADDAIRCVDRRPIAGTRLAGCEHDVAEDMPVSGAREATPRHPASRPKRKYLRSADDAHDLTARDRRPKVWQRLGIGEASLLLDTDIRLSTAAHLFAERPELDDELPGVGPDHPTHVHGRTPVPGNVQAPRDGPMSADRFSAPGLYAPIRRVHAQQSPRADRWPSYAPGRPCRATPQRPHEPSPRAREHPSCWALATSLRSGGRALPSDDSTANLAEIRVSPRRVNPRKRPRRFPRPAPRRRRKRTTPTTRQEGR